MSKYEVVEATMQHVLQLSQNMRKADIEEVWASAHYTPLEALTSSMLCTEHTFAGLADGQVLCLFGIGQATLMSDRGFPWFLSANLADKHAYALAKGSKIVFENMTKGNQFRVLENYVDARYKTAVRWLEWLGFTIHPPISFGKDQLDFHLFTWGRYYV